MNPIALFPGVETDLAMPSMLPPAPPYDQRNKGERAQKAYGVPGLDLFIPSIIVSYNPDHKLSRHALLSPKASLRLKEAECLAQGHTVSAWPRQVSSAIFPTTLKCLFLD